MHQSVLTKRLLLRSRPHSNESPRAYLHRLFSLNGIPLGGRKSRFQLNLRGLDNEVAAYAAKKLTGHQVTPINTDVHLIKTSFSFCPVCFRDSPYGRNAWQVRYYVACHIHEVHLLDQCAACTSRLSWDRKWFDRCNCGYLLENNPAKPATQWTLTVSSAIHQKLSESSHSGLSVPNWMDPMSAKQIQDLLHIVGGEFAFQRGSHGGTSDLPAHKAQHILNESEALMNWPYGLQALLERCASRVTARKKIWFANRYFGRKLAAFVRTLTETDQPVLWRELEAFFIQNGRGRHRNRLRHLFPQELEEGWIDQVDAQEKFGLTEKKLRYWIKRGLVISCDNVKAPGVAWRLVSAADLERVCRQRLGNQT